MPLAATSSKCFYVVIRSISASPSVACRCSSRRRWASIRSAARCPFSSTERAPVDKELRNKSVRKLLPAHLPRDERVYRPQADACPACGGGLRNLGEDVAEQLEYVLANFRMIRHVRPKLACICCDVIVQAPASSRPIARGHRRPRPAGTRPSGQVRQPYFAVPANGDLCPRRC